MIMYAQAQAALIAPGSDVTALRELFTELLGNRHTVQHADLTAGTDIRYPIGEPDAHPLLGRFAPDMELHTPTGTARLAELTRTARPLLLDLTQDASLAGTLSEWHDQVDIVTARPQTPTPVATALLLRPDCYVAWASASPHPASAELETLHTAHATVVRRHRIHPQRPRLPAR